MKTVIRTVLEAEEMKSVQMLFREYADFLGVDLCFQNFEQELANLPGPYAPPSGCLLLAEVDGEPAGCVALKKLADRECEMKRMFVRAPYRNLELGRQLAERIIQEAKNLGYEVMRLDTIPSLLERAVALYRSLGFQEIPPYCFNPIPGVQFMELRLEGARDGKRAP